MTLKTIFFKFSLGISSYTGFYKNNYIVKTNDERLLKQLFFITIPKTCHSPDEKGLRKDRFRIFHANG